MASPHDSKAQNPSPKCEYPWELNYNLSFTYHNPDNNTDTHISITPEALKTLKQMRICFGNGYHRLKYLDNCYKNYCSEEELATVNEKDEKGPVHSAHLFSESGQIYVTLRTYRSNEFTYSVLKKYPFIKLVKSKKAEIPR